VVTFASVVSILLQLVPTCELHSKVLCYLVSFLLLCMYNTMIACLYFDNLKFDILDAMVFFPVCHILRTGRFPCVPSSG